MLKYYTSPIAILPQTEVLHKEYAVLYNVLAFNPIDTRKLGLHLKIRGDTPVTTRQYIGFLVKLAQDRGMVFCIRHKTKVKLYPTTEYRKYSVHTWRLGKKSETDISIEDDNMSVVL